MARQVRHFVDQNLCFRKHFGNDPMKQKSLYHRLVGPKAHLGHFLEIGIFTGSTVETCDVGNA